MNKSLVGPCILYLIMYRLVYGPHFFKEPSEPSNHEAAAKSIESSSSSSKFASKLSVPISRTPHQNISAFSNGFYTFFISIYQQVNWKHGQLFLFFQKRNFYLHMMPRFLI